MTIAPVLWLADELWLVTHDDHSGAAQVHAGALGLGLAAALLAELALHDHLDFQDGALHVVDPSPPGSALAYEIFEQVRAEPQHPATVWLAYLARDAEERVARRMSRAGYLREVRPSRRAGPGYAPADTNAAAWPVARLHSALSRRQRLGQADTVLAGLAAAMGLSGDLFWRTDPDHLQLLLSRLPAGLRELLALTHAAIGDATLTHHRR